MQYTQKLMARDFENAVNAAGDPVPVAEAMAICPERFRGTAIDLYPHKFNNTSFVLDVRPIGGARINGEQALFHPLLASKKVSVMPGREDGLLLIGAEAELDAVRREAKNNAVSFNQVGRVS